MTTTTPGAATTARREGTHGGGGSGRDHRWLVLGVVAIAQLMVVLDATIVNIALPSAQKALGFADTDRQWVVTAYALPFGSLLLLGGKLGDLFGRKTMFLIGLLGFAGASALGGAATGFTVLVVARALQGVFGAVLAPTALATLATTFTDPKERARAFGVFGAVAGGGAAVGLLLGGVLTEYLNWRWCLFVNLFFAAVAFTGAATLLTRTRSEHRPRLDVPGTLLASAGLFCLVYGFSHASTDGWSDSLTIGFLVAGAALLAGFVLVESRVAAPLLPLRILRDRVRGGSYLAVGTSAIAIFGVSLFLTYYMQQVKGFSPIVSGLAFLPMTVCIVAASTTSNVVLLPRTGPRPLSTLGMAMGAVGMFMLSRLTPESGYGLHVLPWLLVLGFGFGFIFAPAINSATYGVAGPDAGVASAMVNTMQQVGGSVGTSLLSTIVASSTAGYVADHRGQPAASLMTLAAVHGYTRAFLTAALIFAVGAVVIGLLLPSGVLGAPQGRPGQAPGHAPEGQVPAGADQAQTGTRQSQIGTRQSQIGQPQTGQAQPVQAQAGQAQSARSEVPAGAGPAHARPAAETAPRRPSLPPLTAPSGPPWSVWGRVQRPDGSVLPEVPLALTDMSGTQVDRTVTDHTGAYRLTPPSSGAYLVICATQDYRPEVGTVAVAGTHVRRDLALVGAGRLGGAVRTARGPLADARLELMDDRGEIVGATTSDPTGGYVLEDLDAGEYTLTVSAPHHRPDVSSVTVPAHQLLSVDVELLASAELSGTVRAASDGRALPEQLVTVVDGTGTVVARGLSDEQGRYRVADLAPGDYTVTASGYEPVTTRVRVGSGDDAVEDLALGWGRASTPGRPSTGGAAQDAARDETRTAEPGPSAATAAGQGSERLPDGEPAR